MQVLVVPPVLMVQREQQGWLERLERPELLEKLEPLVGFAVIRLQRRRFFLSSAVETYTYIMFNVHNININ